MHAVGGKEPLLRWWSWSESQEACWEVRPVHWCSVTYVVSTGVAFVCWLRLLPLTRYVLFRGEVVRDLAEGLFTARLLLVLVLILVSLPRNNRPSFVLGFLLCDLDRVSVLSVLSFRRP